MDNAAARSSNANPVTWIHSASGDKFPFQMDLTHPLWQTFLESGSLSPTQFFRMFFSPPTYFHNPTPWRSRRNSSARLAQKVSELLDSFKPGSISYRPFKKPDHLLNRNVDANNNNHQHEENDDGALRQRLYVDLQRPRPFYRTTASNENTQIVNENEIIHQNPPSLQDVLRLHLVKTHGLPQLKQLLERSDVLPIRVQHLILTFACTDFEEVNPICETESPTTYHVKCLYDQEQKTYRASFFISEVDKNASNLWEEHWQSLNFNEVNAVVPVLALAADELTENVFVITENYKPVQDLDPDLVEEFCRTMTDNVRKYPDLLIPQDLKTHLVLDKNQQRILMQNPLIVKKRNLCQSDDAKLKTLESLLQKS